MTVHVALLTDVALPATAWPEKAGTVRMVQLGQQAIDPTAQAGLDLWVIQQFVQRMGLSRAYPGEHCGSAAVR